MVRKLTTTVTIGLLVICETLLAAGPTLARRPDAPVARVAQKPVPASRLVRPKPVSQVEPRVRNRFESPPSQAEQDDLLPNLRETPEMEDPETDTVIPETELLPEAEALPEPAEQEDPKPEIPEVEEPAMETPDASDTLRPKVPENEIPRPAPAEQVAPEAPAPPAGAYFRLDPPNKLVPVPANELKPGCIYQYTSPTLGRQVWSFVQENGQFWHAFGPGTTQAIEHFDFRMTDEEIMDALKKIDSKLAFDVSSEGARVFMRLQADNTWKLVRTGSVPSIYDVETSQRWEKQWGQYRPVMHICGDTWEYRDGKYVANDAGIEFMEGEVMGEW